MFYSIRSIIQLQRKYFIQYGLSILKTLYDHRTPMHFVTSRKTEINEPNSFSFFFFLNASCFMFEKLKLIQPIK